jgi:hypothetical protein
MNKLIGHLKIYKNDELYFESRNSLSDGASLALTNVLTQEGSFDISDYEIKYFQLGKGSLSGLLPPYSYATNFYKLQSPLTLSEYGEAMQGPFVLPQYILQNGNFGADTTLTTSEAPFVEIREAEKTVLFDHSILIKVLIGTDMANGTNISEVGLFLKNINGLSNDIPTLFAYKTFPAIQKTAGVRIVIDWAITIEGEGTPEYSVYSAVNANGSTRFNVDITSGTSTESNLGSEDQHPSRFEFIIPSSFDPNGAPLLVAVHGLGNPMTQYRTSSTLDEEANARGWFYLAPLGKATIDINKNLEDGIYPHARQIISNWGSNQATNHIKKSVQYIIDRYPINKNKIYLVGFSAGGVGVMNTAAKLTDLSASSWRPAAICNHSGALSSRKTWWVYAPSSFTSPQWSTPPNSELRTSGKTLIFWTAGQGNPDTNFPDFAAFDERLSTASIWYDPAVSGGVNWPTLSGSTPASTPFYYNEIATIDYNLVTSSNLSLSTCLLLNLTHIPLYNHYCTDDSQGGFIFEPNNLLSGLLVTSGLFSNYKMQVSTAANLPVDVNTHSPQTIDVKDLCDFFAQYSLSTPYSASTIVTRSGNYWFFYIPDNYTGGYGGSSSSGLGLFLWNLSPTTNELTISAYNQFILDSNTTCPIFYPSRANLTINQNNPLIVYNLSGISPTTSASTRRITVAGFGGSSLYSVRYAEQTGPNSFGPWYNCVISTDGANWRVPSLGLAGANSPAVNVLSFPTPQDLILLRRFGKYEIVKTFDPNI